MISYQTSAADTPTKVCDRHNSKKEIELFILYIIRSWNIYVLQTKIQINRWDWLLGKVTNIAPHKFGRIRLEAYKYRLIQAAANLPFRCFDERNLNTTSERIKLAI